MPKSEYPNAADLQSYLEVAGFTVDAALAPRLGDAIEAGIGEFEATAGRKMLWTAAAVTRRVDPPTSRSSTLILPWDLCALTSIIYLPTGGTSETLVEYTDYLLEPEGGPSLLPAKPWTAVEFFARRWHGPLSDSERRSLRFLGKFAYGVTLPDDVWEAMLCQGALLVWAQIAQDTTSGRLGWKEGDASEDYGAEPWTRLRDNWGDTYKRVVSKYRKVTM